MKDPQYVERLLGNVAGASVSSLPDRRSFLKDMPDATIGFLLGKGLTPQEIMDVTECWWREGYEFRRKHK